MALTKGQQRCVETLDRPLVVAAGAGSGKTFTLTKRIVTALQDGYLDDIGEVCAITYTRKAAAELKSRIKGELRACNLIDQALKVDEAWISTIHGMCARILRAHALELGIDPAFTVIEDAQLQEYLERAVDTVLERAQLEGEAQPRVQQLFAEYPARSYGGRDASVEAMLHKLVQEASSHADGANAFVMPGEALPAFAALQQVIALVEDLRACAESEKQSAKRDEWLASTGQALDDVRAALEDGDVTPERVLGALNSLKLAKTFGSKEYKERVQEARGQLGALIMEVRLGAAREHLETLVELSRQALDEFATLKHHDAALDNNDLLVLAARAIQEHPRIAACYTDKFKLVMVDEFQDTDQMQVDMIKRLAGPDACRLCTVGDAQQSIYRFRGADVSVYRQHLGVVRASWGDESIIELSQNFRSHPDVLSFVDRVFERPEMFGNSFMSLKPGRDEDKVKEPFGAQHPRIVVQHTTRPYRGVASEDVYAESARRIARAFADLAEAGHSAGEMVLLLGRMTHAAEYARALRDQGLPCVIAGGSVFSQTTEAQFVRELVHVIANPYETESLFNVLTGPMFGLSADDLLKAGGLKGFWQAAGEDEAPDGASLQLSCALRVMSRVRARSGRVSVARIVEDVAADSGWLSRLQAGGAEGLASAGNVFKAVRILRRIERQEALGPVSTMRRFDEALASSKEAPGALSVSGGNSVRIMTIHSSKGLEFPIVAVAEVRENRLPTARLQTASIAGKVYLSLDLGRTASDNSAVDKDAVRTFVMGECASEDEWARAVVEAEGALQRRLAIQSFALAGDEEEAKRLLYVALTRAKEALVVSSMGVRIKDNPIGIPKSALAGVFEALGIGEDAAESSRSSIDFGGSTSAVAECVALVPSDGEEAVESPAVQDDEPFFVPADEQRFALERKAWKPLHQDVFSYSSIADASHEGDLLSRLADAHVASIDDSSYDFDTSNSFDSDRATDLGTAFHRLAQYAVVARGADGALCMPSEERIEALSRTCNLDSLQRERLQAALERWFGSNVAHEMMDLSSLSAEVPFFVAVEDAYLEGEIDLLGFDDARQQAYVVDYKTGGNDDETADDLRAKHVLQATCYAYAILLQGAQTVDATFVRVERETSDGQPQCVRYRFVASDLPALKQSIAAAYKQMPR